MNKNKPFLKWNNVVYVVRFKFQTYLPRINIGKECLKIFYEVKTFLRHNMCLTDKFIKITYFFPKLQFIIFTLTEELNSNSISSKTLMILYLNTKG